MLRHLFNIVFEALHFLNSKIIYFSSQLAATLADYDKLLIQCKTMNAQVQKKTVNIVALQVGAALTTMP